MPLTERHGSCAWVTDASRLIHADEQLLVVDKPPGIAVIPGRGEELADSLRGHWQSALQTQLWVVHRIDRDTSGLVLFARDAQTHTLLCSQFEQRLVHKTYWALAAGVLPLRAECRLDLHTARKGKMRLALARESGALPSITVFNRLSLRTGSVPISELAVQPHTGRQHQIRVHLRALGTPLFGDIVYGRSTLTIADPAPRLALHAWKLDFAHPRQGNVEFEAHLPTDLQQWLARYR